MVSEVVANSIAERLGGKKFGQNTEIFKFEKIKREKQAAIKNQPDLPVLDFGVGEPHLPADPRIVEVLVAEAGLPENRSYADNGISEFQEAAANYMNNVFGVNHVDPQTQVLHGVGSKSLLSIIPTCFINQNDVVLMTTPGYGVMAHHAKVLGAEIYSLPLEKGRDFLPDLDAIPAEILRRSKLLYLNYPNNPTGACAPRAFFEKAIALAREHSLIVIHDAAYAALRLDGAPPLSILSVPGAEDVAVELHSLSKAFNMTGWRLAFAVGNAGAIAAIAHAKNECDSGQFRAIQKAGARALSLPQISQDLSECYRRRFAGLIPHLKDVGFDVEVPSGGFFCYAPAPLGARDVDFASAEEASLFLIQSAHISTVPWDDAGRFVRFSATFEADTLAEEEEVLAEVGKRISTLGLRF